MGFFSELGRQAGEVYARLTISQKIAFVLLVTLVVTFMVWFTGWGSRANYVPLTAQPVDASERTAAVGRLKQMGIDIREKAGVLEVSEPQLSRAMAALAEAGVLPSDFSMLDRTVVNEKGVFTTPEDSRFERAVALQEFLGEVIRHMEGIRMAKVVFDVPPPYAGMFQEKKGTASVIVWLKDKGSTLVAQQVEGIASLISGSLRDIPKGNVRIVDGQGRPYRVRRTDGLSGLVAERHEQELMYEARQAKLIQDLLSYLGEQVKVLVDVKMDFNQKSTRTKEVDPDKIAEALLSSKKSESEPVGSAGTGSSTPGTAASLAATPSGERESEQEKTMHPPEYSTTETTLQEAPGKITDVSVTVYVPREGVIEQLKSKGVTIDDKATAQDLAPELDEIRVSIANALGMPDDAKVVVRAVSFPKPPVPEAPPEPEMMAHMWGTYGTSAVLGLMTMVAMFLLWRMVKVPVQVSLGTSGGGAFRSGLPTSDEELLAGLGGPDADALRSARLEEKVKDMVTESPQDAAKLITRWVHTEG